MTLPNLLSVGTRLYIAGVLVPFNSINVTTSFNAMPRCTLSLPPSKELYGIGRHDRVPIHIFISNSFVGKQNEYFLFFEGEVDSFAFSSNSIGREFVINGQSNLAFLKDITIKMVKGLDDAASTHVQGAEYSTLNASGHMGLSFPASLFMQGISPVSDDSAKIIKYPYEFIKNFSDFLYGYLRNGTEKIPGRSKLALFYESYADKLKFPKRFSKVPFFDTDDIFDNGFPLLNGIQTLSALQQLTGLANNAPSAGSAYDFINHVTRSLEYEFSIQNAPTFIKEEGVLNSIILKPMLYDATPPKCNVIFGSHVNGLTLQEKVYGVPTRIRTRDVSGSIALLTMGNNSALTEFGITDFYPYKNPYDPEPMKSSTQDNKDLYYNVLLEDEEITGPFVFQTEAPPWLSYISAQTAKESASAREAATQIKDYGNRIRKHLLLLKQNEARTLSVNMAFNPFITAGYPGVVYDAKDSNFSFLGQVLSVSHNISKGGLSTNVQFAFVRDPADELNEATSLRNTVDGLNQITKFSSEMSTVYEKTLGCGAESFENLVGAISEGKEQFSANAAYLYNSRSITTFEEYLGFMGFDVEYEEGDYRGKLPTLLTGGELTVRKDPELVNKLSSIAKDTKRNEVYRLK